MDKPEDVPSCDNKDPLEWLKLALELAVLSPPKPTNYCVGAVLISPSKAGHLLSDGYTLELPGNTHAEECCLQKFAEREGVSVDKLPEILPDDCILYTTVEPCVKRLSGKKPCVQRIIEAKRIKKVVVGLSEPDTFVSDNNARKMLEDAEIEYEHLPGLEQEIIQVATRGHVEDQDKTK